LKTNSNASKRINQAFSRKNLYDPNPIIDLKINPRKYMIDSKRYTWIELACADILLDRMNEKGFVAYTQESIALEAGCHHDTVSSVERKLTDDGLLVIQRNYRMPTLGRVSSYFKSRSVKRRLSTFLPSLSLGAYAPYKIPQSVITENRVFLLVSSGSINNNNSELLDSFLYIKDGYYNRMRVSKNSRLVESKNTMTLTEKNNRWKTPTIIRIARTLHLTMAGSIELTKFPEEVLIQAERSMRRQSRYEKRLYDPFIYFLGICHKICKEGFIQWNDTYTKSLKLEYGITSDMDLTEIIEFNDDLECDNLDEDEFKKLKKFQKKEARIASSSLNAQLSYRKPSGERPSVATPIDIKKTMVDQFESSGKIINNTFTRSLYAMFKQDP
jgi:hypothetical protein